MHSYDIFIKSKLKTFLMHDNWISIATMNHVSKVNISENTDEKFSMRQGLLYSNATLLLPSFLIY